MPNYIDQMFYIQDELFFHARETTGRDVCKSHYAYGHSLKDEVVKDLEARYGKMLVQTRSKYNDNAPFPSEHHLDFGGMHWAGWTPERFVVEDSLTFSFHAHHLDEVCSGIDHALGNLYLDGAYGKIFTWQVVMAVRPDTLRTLREMIRAKEDELRTRSDKAFEDHTSAMHDLRNQGVAISPPLYKAKD